MGGVTRQGGKQQQWRLWHHSNGSLSPADCEVCGQSQEKCEHYLHLHVVIALEQTEAWWGLEQVRGKIQVWLQDFKPLVTSVDNRVWTGDLKAQLLWRGTSESETYFYCQAGLKRSRNLLWCRLCFRGQQNKDYYDGDWLNPQLKELCFFISLVAQKQ